MADFKKALHKTLKWEGGYCNHPLDKGGATNLGITQSTYNFYYEGDVKDITMEQAETIYRTGYWSKIMGDDIKSQSVAEYLFDWIVNAGLSTPVKKLQILVGTEADGKMGKKTLKALNDKDPKILFNQLVDCRVAFYRALVDKKPSQKVFLNGWLNRAKSFIYEA